MAQTRPSIKADTVFIDGDTLIILGDSLIITPEAKPVYWERGGNFNMSIQQVSLTNWAAGGQSSLALHSGITLFANFNKDNKIWDTKLTMGFGFNRQSDRNYATRKTADNFVFISKYGRELSPQLYLSTQIDLRTQLLTGHQYFRPAAQQREQRNVISDLFSPAYVQSSTGLNYQKEFKNKDRVSLIISPFTGRFTIVLNDSLSRAGAFGVLPGERIRPEIGPSLTSSAKLTLMDNITWRADLNLFSNFESLGNTVVNFNSILNLKVNRFITTRIETILIYDENVYIRMDDGRESRAIQLQNMINFGIGIDF